jgi:NAD(P)-dependent dehydrogenase (short-subunit alcohol dehydrogenase family)
MYKSIVLVTGAGTGIGHLSVKALALAGHTVYASLRDIDGRNAAKVRALRDWAFANGADVRAVELDVLSQASADAAVQTIVAERGRLDVVVHNAGHLVIGPTEAFTPEEISKVFDTKLLGTQRVNKAVLPVLRRQQQGLVLWVSSSTTRGGFPPFLGPYAAAKAAMDSIAVTMAFELARFNIETSIVVPGAFTAGTDHFANAGKPADAATGAAYDARYEGLMDQIGARLTGLMPPEADPAAVAADIARIVSLPHGTRPFRSITDFVDDGATAVTEVAERVRVAFAERIGIADLLKPGLAEQRA